MQIGYPGAARRAITLEFTCTPLSIPLRVGPNLEFDWAQHFSV
jgi:hypothetical protein